MSTPAGIVGKLLLGGASEAVAFAGGVAIAPTLAPVLQELENTTWAEFPVKPPPAVTLALGVAQGQVDEATARQWAKETGFGDAAMTALIDIANTGPGVAEAFTLWRRDAINDDGFKRAAKRAGLEPEWITALLKVKDVLLTPAELAVMIQRTVVPNPDILPNQPSTAGSNVPPMPVVDIDVLAEARGSGTNLDRLRAKARIIGLPASPDLAARMHFRDIITEGAYNQAILEGNTRGEWAQFLLDGFRDILTSGQYVERQLRGFTDRKGRLADTAKHGMSIEDSDKLYEVLGRSPSIHTLVVGLARGGKYPGSYANVPEPYRSEIQRSNIREEWSEVVYAARYSYPSAFVLRSLAEAGDLGDTAAVHQILLEIGWPPKLAEQVSAKWQPKGAAADPHVAKAQTQLWNRAHSSYVADESTDAQATTALTAAGVAAATIPQVLTTWQAEKALVRKQLSPADLRKAYQKQDLNVATGAAWTRADAVARLIELGYDSEDAENYLNIG